MRRCQEAHGLQEKPCLHFIHLNRNSPSTMLLFCKCECILWNTLKPDIFRKKKKAKNSCLGSCKTDWQWTRPEGPSPPGNLGNKERSNNKYNNKYRESHGFFWQECFPKRILNLYLLKLIGDKWVNKDRKWGPLDSLEYFSFCVVCMDEQDQATGITQATFYFAWIKEHINQNKLESGLLSHL